MVTSILNDLDAWFQEPATSNDRPKLLSKLAILELCGWLEVEFDRLILVVELGRLNDSAWVKKKVIPHSNGFTYDKHWRPMLCMVVGEVFARRVESAMDAAHPTELDQLKPLLEDLWKYRCSFAHADITTNVATQQIFNAPSWTINQHARLKVILGNYEKAMLTVMKQI